MTYNSMMKCTILDYGTGNLQSVQNAFEFLGHTAKRSSDLNDLNNTDVLIFPGQGSFGPAMQKLKQMKLIDPLINYVNEKRPFIGICLGFQLLFDRSEETNKEQGLGCFKGAFEKFKSNNLSIPHMGWNTIKAEGTNSILDQFNNERFYFVHSYFLPVKNNQKGAITTYGTPFIAALANKTQLITQFHPEKSGNIGLDLLKEYFLSIK